MNGSGPVGRHVVAAICMLRFTAVSICRERLDLDLVPDLFERVDERDDFILVMPWCFHDNAQLLVDRCLGQCAADVFNFTGECIGKIECRVAT